MAELFVMCSACGLRGTLAHSRKELLDPEGKCKEQRPPARCPHLRDVSPPRIALWICWNGTRSVRRLPGAIGNNPKPPGQIIVTRLTRYSSPSLLGWERS